jgi:hypothetical protein
MQDAAQVVDERDQRTLGHMAGGAVMGGMVGTLAGLAKGGIHPRMLHPTGGLAGKLGLVGTIAGAGAGYMAADREQHMAEQQLKIAAQMFIAGQNFARAVLALPPAEKAALFKELDQAVGHGVSAMGIGAGRLMQGVGHAGKALEDVAKNTKNHEALGRVAGGAALVGGTALALHALQRQREADQYALSTYPQGGTPWMP